ncbi:MULTISPECIES: hypothetical protein [unclassified Psychrobacter]|uniref:hypothetical protein n=2 Tax=Psychrobacter TaxID=497 RepID=UPI000427A116|nr:MULTISPECIES: hypothetical protein [unclassified Psychrobacter]
MSDSYYLFSSFKENPEFLFDGYCFVGSDFIFGNLGAKNYISENNTKIEGGEDGCYIVAHRQKEKFTFGSDYGGYKKVLYYYDPLNRVWAVSNSLRILVKHLRDFGVNITLNLSQLYFHALTKGVAAQQPVSFSTIANGIFLLPTNTTLVIDSFGLEIRNNNNNKYENQKLSYNYMLSRYVAIWTARFETIFSDSSLVINQALTGGIDSRAVFSITSLARKKIVSSKKARHSFKCGKIRGDSADLDVAGKITEHYGYNLNENILKGEIRYLNGEETYSRWKNLSLGLYFPTYFDSRKTNPFHINISGGGGEKYRPYYRQSRDDTFEKFIERNLSQMESISSQIEMEGAMLNSMRYLDANNQKDPLQLHYSEFRNRLHSGFFSQFIVDISPLNSHLLSDIADSFSDKISSSQLLYDLINLEPEVLNFDFDKKEKAPKVHHISDLTLLDGFGESIQKGKLYLDSNNLEERNTDISSKSNAYTYYLEKDVEKAISTKEVNHIWDKDFINNVESKVRRLSDGERLTHAMEGISISSLIASSMFYL